MLLVAVGLAMDAFAVSVGKGLTIQGQCKKACIVTGLYFGGFQSIMPLLGFLCGETVIQYIAPTMMTSCPPIWAKRGNRWIGRL